MVCFTLSFLKAEKLSNESTFCVHTQLADYLDFARCQESISTTVHGSEAG